MDNITQSIISIDYRHNKQSHKAGHTFMSGSACQKSRHMAAFLV